MIAGTAANGTAARFDHVDVVVVDATETETLEATSTITTAMTVVSAAATAAETSPVVQSQFSRPLTAAHHRRRSTAAATTAGSQLQNVRSMHGTQALQQPQQQHQRKRKTNLDRNERSTNVSLLSGTARKIQILMKNRLIQLLPDGTVNGTQDDRSDYSEYRINCNCKTGMYLEV